MGPCAITVPRVVWTIAFSILLALMPRPAQGSGERILHAFKGGTDGYTPELGTLTFDKFGNLYGATQSGGTSTLCYLGCGTIFRLRRTNTGWSENVIYSFGGGADGSLPNGDLAIDSAGTFYGTTFSGGDHNYGTVFELKRSASGWSKSILHSFASGSDGVWPLGGVIVDGGGDLYGTTLAGGGGAKDGGIIFELSPSSGGWVYSVLHVFGNGTDGINPLSRLTRDASGNLFGTTALGGTGGSYCGSNGCGVAFEMTLGAGNVWSESVIYNFGSSITDAAEPHAALALDSAGTLFGTTVSGGPCIAFCGTVFELSPAGGGVWNEKVIFSFLTTAQPYGGLAMDSGGSLYGTTVYGGGQGNCKVYGVNWYCGTIYKLSQTEGVWTETLLHSFSNPCGTLPFGTVILDAAGKIYGTTPEGGSYGGGLVYQFNP